MAGTGKYRRPEDGGPAQGVRRQDSDDIRPDFEVVAAVYAKIADALKGVNLKAGSTPDPAAIAKLTKLSSEIDTTALTKAYTDIGVWAQKNCSTK